MTVQPPTMRTLRQLIHLCKQAGITHIPIDTLETTLNNIEQTAQEETAHLENLDKVGT